MYVFTMPTNFAGANPTIVSYNTTAVKSYTSSLDCFENKIIFLYFEKLI
jgi:hypothetical protein